VQRRDHGLRCVRDPGQPGQADDIVGTVQIEVDAGHGVARQICGLQAVDVTGCGGRPSGGRAVPNRIRRDVAVEQVEFLVLRVAAQMQRTGIRPERPVDRSAPHRHLEQAVCRIHLPVRADTAPVDQRHGDQCPAA
jgi:hypothetical protein